MPTFCFLCRACGDNYEEFRWPSEGLPTRCPSCAEPYGQGFEQDWMRNRPGGWTYGEDRATTLGQQVEYNNRRLGREKVDELFQDRRPPSRWHEKLGTKPVEGTKELPWWRDGTIGPRMEKPLDVSKVSNIERYIETGQM